MCIIQAEEGSDISKLETVDGTNINQRRHSSIDSMQNSKMPAMQRHSSTNLVITEESENCEENEDEEEEEDDDADDAGSKESFKERVINTNMNDNEKTDNGVKGLRRKSLAPAKHE